MNEEKKIILSSITPEQYKKFFKGLPILPILIEDNKEEYINILSNENDILKSLLYVLNKNNIQFINVNLEKENCKIRFILDKESAQIIKYLRKHLNSEECKFQVKIINDSYDVELTTSNLKNLIDIKILTENYFSINRKIEKNLNEVNSDYILSDYENIPEEYIKYLSEYNKYNIIHLKEKNKQKNTIISDIEHNYNVNDIMKNDLKISEIHLNDPIYKDIPFNKLTDDMKQVMCNNYFKKIFITRLNMIKQMLKENFGINFNINYNKQYQINLPSYGIAGNMPPIENLNCIDIKVFMYSNLNYCSINNDIASINSELLGQLMITILHEHQHILQQISIINNNNSELTNKISLFEEQCKKDSTFYENNYKNDPAELDANLISFVRAKELARLIGINDIENTILKKVNDNYKYADENCRIYDIEFIKYDDVIFYLKDKLNNIDLESIISNSRSI